MGTENVLHARVGGNNRNSQLDTMIDGGVVKKANAAPSTPSAKPPTLVQLAFSFCKTKAIRNVTNGEKAKTSETLLAVKLRCAQYSRVKGRKN